MASRIEYYKSGERGKFTFLWGAGALVVAYLSGVGYLPYVSLGAIPVFLLVVAGLALLGDWLHGNFTPFLRLESDRLVYSRGLYVSDREFSRDRISDVEFRARESLFSRVHTCQIRMERGDDLEFPADLLTDRDERTFENRVLNWARREA